MVLNTNKPVSKKLTQNDLKISKTTLLVLSFRNCIKKLSHDYFFLYLKID